MSVKFRRDDDNDNDNEQSNRQLNHVEMMKIISENHKEDVTIETISLLREEKLEMNGLGLKKNSRVIFDFIRLKPFQAACISFSDISSVTLIGASVFFSILGGLLIIGIIATPVKENPFWHHESSSLLYRCSSNPNNSSDYKSENDKADAFEFYDRNDDNNNEISSIINLTQVLYQNFDGWNRNYFVSKEQMLTWKLSTFGRHLKSGDIIYESACGIGLNLLMTLDLLDENLGITNLTVYGNDYLEESVNTANKILEAAISSPDQRVIERLGSTKGSICWGDSTNLEFVPSDAFDLVFTGYIDPLVDPLNLGANLTSFLQKEKVDVANCKSKDPEKQDLAKKSQKAQEDWFSSWVKEMIRLAKPGKRIIIEEVAPPLCTKLDDWGGVTTTWWTKAIIDYGWNVDSNVFIKRRTQPGRYHVMLRKKG